MCRDEAITPSQHTQKTKHNTTMEKKLNNILTSLIKASAEMKKEKFSITSLANWCDKAKEFEAVQKAASKAARKAKKDESIALSKRLSLGVLTIGLPKVKARVLFKQVKVIANEQAKRVKSINKNWKHISKHIAK